MATEIIDNIPQIEYLHGAHEEEQERLSALNRIVNEGSLRGIALEGHERILDLGCGLGQFARAMARSVVPLGHVVGVERCPEQLATARRLAARDGEAHLVEFREGDVHRLPLAPDEFGRFDIVHARFVLEHVGQPQRVVDQMVRAARPGGRIVI